MDKVELFEKYLKDDELLIDLLESVKDELFDYLMYRTGEKLFSTNIIDEVYSSVLSDSKSFESLEQFRISVFKTARNFSMDRVAFSIESLEKASLNSEDQQVHQKVCSLGAAVREIVLLCYRYDFDIDSISLITATGVGVIQGYLDDINEDDHLLAIKRLVLFPFPQKQSDSKIAVSEIISDLKKSRRKGSSKIVKAFCVILMICCLFYFFYSKELLDFIRSFLKAF